MAAEPWSKPPFWAKGKADKMSASRDAFAELARLREEIQEVDPDEGAKEFARLYDRINALESQLGLTRTTGGVGMDPSPRVHYCACDAQTGRRGGSNHGGTGKRTGGVGKVTSGRKCSYCGRVRRDDIE